MPGKITLAFFILIPALFFWSPDALASCGTAAPAGGCPISTTDSSNIVHYQILSATLCMVQSNLTRALVTMYGNIANAMQPILQTMLLIYIVLYGYAIAMGLAGTERGDFVTRMVKLVLISGIILNQSYFFTYVCGFFTLAMEGLAQLASVQSIAGCTAPSVADAASAGLFANLDCIASNMIGALGSLGDLIIAFLLTGPGFVISLVLSTGSIFLVKMLFTVFRTISLAMISLTMALLFAPIFLCMALYQQTRDLFYGWLSVVTSYTLQPVIIVFYFILTAQLFDISGVLNIFISGSVIVPYSYTFNYLVNHVCIPWYILNPGPITAATATACMPVSDPTIPSTVIPSCTACISQTYPVGFLTLINVPNNTVPPTTIQMSVISAALLKSFQWMIVLLATSKFMQVVPNLATRLSVIAAPGQSNVGAALYAPRLISVEGDATDRDGGTSAVGGMIMPGFTRGYGGDAARQYITRPVTRALEKVRILPRVFGQDIEALAAKDRIKEFEEAAKELNEIHRRRGDDSGMIAQMEDIINLAVANEKTSELQLDQLDKMVRKTGSSNLVKVYNAALKEREAAAGRKEAKGMMGNLEREFAEKARGEADVKQLEKALAEKEKGDAAVHELATNLSNLTTVEAKDLIEKAVGNEHVTKAQLADMEAAIRRTGDQGLMDAYQEANAKFGQREDLSKIKTLMEEIAANRHVSKDQMAAIKELVNRPGGGELMSAYLTASIENRAMNAPDQVNELKKLIEIAAKNKNITDAQLAKIQDMVDSSGDKGLKTAYINAFSDRKLADAIIREIEDGLTKVAAGTGGPNLVNNLKDLMAKAYANQYVTGKRLANVGEMVKKTRDRGLADAYTQMLESREVVSDVRAILAKAQPGKRTPADIKKFEDQIRKAAKSRYVTREQLADIKDLIKKLGDDELMEAYLKALDGAGVI